MLVFSVYIPFLISRVRPVHSFFEKKSILENPSQIFTNLFFHAYLLTAKKMDFALTDVFILVKNRLFSQKTSRKFYGKSCQIDVEIDK